MKILFLMLLCISGVAAPMPPHPPSPDGTHVYLVPVKRPKPFLSPRHASDAKVLDRQMFRPASDPPVLPMKAFFHVVNNEFGTYEFSAQALKPAGLGVKFEVSKTPNGDYIYLSEFGATPYEEQSFVTFYSYTESLFVRAYLTTAATRSVINRFDVNKAFKGAKAWSVRR
jgi:hypothetical protein